MNNSSKNRIISGIGWAYGERILAQIISLIVSIILARLLDPEHYGIIAIVTVFINILDALVSGGFGSALVQKKDADDLDFNTICWFSICLSLALYIILYFSSPLIANFYKMPQLLWISRVMGIRVIISSFNSVQHAYVQRNMQFKRFFFATLGGTLVSAVVGIVMAFKGFGVWALVGQYMTNSCIDTIVLRLTIKWKPKLQWSFERLKSMMNFGLKMLGATLVNTLQDNIRTLVVGKVFTAEDLAYYNQGKKYPATLMNNLVGSVQKVLFPAFSENQQDINQIKNQMRKSIRVSSFVLVPTVIGMIALADTFIILLLTEKWAAAIPFLRILSLIYLTRTMNSVLQSGLLAIGKSGANMFHEFVGSGLSIILICVGSFYLNSVEFIAWSYVVVMIVGTLVFSYFVRKHFKYGYKELASDFFPYLFCSIFMGSVIYFVGRIRLLRLFVFFLQIVIGILTYVGVCKLFRIRELDICLKYCKSYCVKFYQKTRKK